MNSSGNGPEVVTVEELLQGLEVTQQIIEFIGSMLSAALTDEDKAKWVEVPEEFVRLRKYFDRC